MLEELERKCVEGSRFECPDALIEYLEKFALFVGSRVSKFCKDSGVMA